MEQTEQDVRDLERHRELNDEWFAGQEAERDLDWEEKEDSDE